ncbi:hypothetical protein COEREDRAFT_91975 [Coemansia reversa NRRL 1564]|uniref:Uncharacterized protein n=1 Tax=Coemansia reversa (strain ATCC 12441 / NRRL 1564) TaxID=763665 RepID=A0A2G5BEY0_COERN|nr:hypothetical protein COEREDRAFT_91975 [Coemansia reversa NRRL 1564]|eukprot:PIA17267.1 hypothetical protein COEREDRAFT_91975 [Coemansia reversa NRRL 1564]
MKDGAERNTHGWIPFFSSIYVSVVGHISYQYATFVATIFSSCIEGPSGGVSGRPSVQWHLSLVHTILN